ncbi:MAG: phage minor head protein [Gammaproteobacteria bacterium]
MPPKDAIEYFRAKGLRPGFSYLDAWREEHAASFTVAKAMQLDVLTTIREAVDKALAEGVPFARFSAGLTPLLQSLGWWGKREVTDPLTGEKVSAQLGSPERLKLIYDANLRSARAAGQWQRIQRTKTVLPFLLYLLGPSREHRLQHVRWQGLLLPVDDPFWKRAYPPNGWGCKCHVRQVSRIEAEKLREQGAVRGEAPPFQMRDVVNRRTGETLQVPEGIDPGWDFNPGVERFKYLRQRLMVKQRDFPVPRRVLVDQFVKQLQATPSIKQPSLIFEPMPSAILPKMQPEIESALSGKWIALDHDYTIHTLLGHSSEHELLRGQIPITVEDLASIVEIVSAALEIKPGYPPTSKSGAPRIEVTSVWRGYRYTVILEPRNKRNQLAIFNIWKRRE